MKCLDVQRPVWMLEETASITENSVKGDEADGGGVATGYNTTLWQSRKRGARRHRIPIHQFSEQDARVDALEGQKLNP